MAQALQPGSRRYTYADLEALPEDDLRREIIDGELIVHASPAIRHQIASGNMHNRLFTYAKQRGGLVLAAPTDNIFSDENVVVPDLIFVRHDHMDRVGKRFIDGPPDLVIEISSPTTRRLELVRKKELYQRFGVPEYWYVDLDAERVECYVLTEAVYPAPVIKYPGRNLESTQLEGFSMPVDEALAAEP